MRELWSAETKRRILDATENLQAAAKDTSLTSLEQRRLSEIRASIFDFCKMVETRKQKAGR